MKNTQNIYLDMDKTRKEKREYYIAAQEYLMTTTKRV